MGRRGQTDVKVPEYWILLPVVAVVASYVLGIISFMYDVLAGILVTVIGTIAAVILIAFLIYQLLKRRNEHMAREAQLRRELMDFFRFRGEELGIGNRTGPYVQAMQAFDRGSLMHEEPQSALLWTILCLIPGINLVAIVLTLFWLTDYAPGHDRRFYGFVQNAHYAAEQTGMGPLMPGAWKSISERSYVLYLIISVLLPVFAIWWFYVLIKDLNDHFDNEWLFEDNVMAELQKAG
jgi:ABC-type transport system involved in cytochrome bd biosynthesis fused ATPase/permease subunit